MTARYQSWCGTCSGPCEPGEQLVKYDGDDKWSHERCLLEAPATVAAPRRSAVSEGRPLHLRRVVPTIDSDATCACGKCGPLVADEEMCKSDRYYRRWLCQQEMRARREMASFPNRGALAAARAAAVKAAAARAAAQ
jgi:hypothetical protein